MKTFCLAFAFFSTALYCQRVWIKWMKKFQLGEAIKSYGPKSHFKKKGTPSMGGIVGLFLVPFVIVALYAVDIAGFGTLVKIWSYPVLAALVGFTDDTLKLVRTSSEGLASLQKLLLQILVTLPWAYIVSRSGVYMTPGYSIGAVPGFMILSFLGVGILNAVNVTDGLDGLAAGTVSISLLAAVVLFDAEGVPASAMLGLSILLAFLWHNAHPANVFMGDVGSHMWGALLLSLCLNGHSLILILPLGFIFGIELISSAIQIVAIRKFNRKVFLMSPFHHHFEEMGWKETTIVTRFWLIHIAGIAAILIFLYSILGRALWDA